MDSPETVSLRSVWEAWLCRLAEEEGEETQPGGRQGCARTGDTRAKRLEVTSTLRPSGAESGLCYLSFQAPGTG